MTENRRSQIVKKQYDEIFRQCVSLNTELYKLVPLAKKMHLLSSNAVSSAARAGSKGNAFRVLTQDIQHLGDEVSDCIDATQQMIREIVAFSSSLARDFNRYVIYGDVLRHIDGQSTLTSPIFFQNGQQKMATAISDNHRQLRRCLATLEDLLSPFATLVKKGEYLAVFSSVEAAYAEEHGVSFDAVALMLRDLVRQLGRQSSNQKALLRDLRDAMDKQQSNQRTLLNAN